MDWEVGIATYTRLYAKLIGNKDLLYSTGKSIQYSVIAYMGKESKKKDGYMCICVADSLCYTSETNTTWSKSTILQ